MLRGRQGFVRGMIELLGMALRHRSLGSSELKIVNPRKSVTVHKDEPLFLMNCLSNQEVIFLSLFATSSVAFDYRAPRNRFGPPPSLRYWINSHLYGSSPRRGLQGANDFGVLVEEVNRPIHGADR